MIRGKKLILSLTNKFYVHILILLKAMYSCKIPPEIFFEIFEWLDIYTLFELINSGSILRKMLSSLCDKKLKRYLCGYLDESFKDCLDKFSQLELFIGAFIVRGIVSLETLKYKYMYVNFINTCIKKKKVEIRWVNQNFLNVIIFMDMNVKNIDILLQKMSINGKCSIFCESVMEIDRICIFKTTYKTVYKELFEDAVLCDDENENCNMISYNIFT